ncbi:MAG: toll/interleukin-1 receptor domain-containing protein [Christensenellaceae bacterium]|nr:toll/interleukin-1 receptor domain-containing protein [Christensenellaceae bacterium]
MIEHPKVFISYSHQNSDYETKILDFSNRLREDGIDANIDLYEEAPSEGWPRWMENQIKQSDYV